MEYWTEADIKPFKRRDSDLLLRVDSLIHETLKETFLTWHFFWEPELRLRIEWKSKEGRDRNKEKFFSALEEWKMGGYIIDWNEGNHGRSGVYAGEEEIYGPEMWPYHKNLWMTGSEFSLACNRFSFHGTLTKDKDFHWQRFVHLLTNQINGFWAEEIRLCLAQAWGRTKLLQERSRTKDIEKILKLIEEAHNKSPILNEAENRMLGQ